jgi:5,6,7,8-tetrahydromethanopterin hydro-lyase
MEHGQATTDDARLERPAPMSSDASLDGRIGQGWGGRAPNGSHVNVVLGRRGGATAAAIVTTFTSPSPGHTPVLVCVGPDQPSYEAVVPATIMMNKATATDERHQTMTWGAAQLGIGQGVLDAVADGLLVPDAETVVFVAVWVDPTADDEAAVRAANREAVRRAIGEAVQGPDPRAVERLVRERGSLRNPFYGGE